MTNIDAATIQNILYILILMSLFVPTISKEILGSRRMMALWAFEKKSKSRVISMIQRQETMSLLGIPLSRYIDIEDSEQVLRAIRMTPPEMPISMILHTPGGLVLAAEQIACALKRHKGKVTVFVPHYAMSGGTIIALAADEIVMDPNAVLGPVDPQLGGIQSSYPAASILKALEQPNPNRNDEILIMGDEAKKAIDQVCHTVYSLLLKHQTPEKAAELAKMLSHGRWTHDYAIDIDKAREIGLNVNDQMPWEIYKLMKLYPQPNRLGVEYIPIPYMPPAGSKEKRAQH